MYGMTFNGIKKDYVVTLRGKRRPPWAPLRRNLVEVPGLAGAHHESTDVEPRRLDIPILIESNGLVELQTLKEDLAAWLVTDTAKELIFDDEPNRIYYAMVDGQMDVEEIISVGAGVINFICDDPYKYGVEKSKTIDNLTQVEVDGTVETFPIIRATLTSDTTFVAISNGKDMNMVGRIKGPDDKTYEPETRIFTDIMASTVGWTDSTSIEEGIKAGTLRSNGYSFVPESYGTGTKWHGPVLKKSLPETVQDFRFESYLGQIGSSGEVGSVEIAGLDASNNFVFKMLMTKRSAHSKAVWARIRAGNALNGHDIMNEYGAYDWVWQHFYGVLGIQRVGNKWEAYVSRVDDNGKRHSSSRKLWTDSTNIATAPVTQIQVQLWQHSNIPVTEQYISDIKGWRVNPKGSDIPIIGHTGDVIEFNHIDDVITLNGEDITKHKAFIGSYFPLKPGVNPLVIEPFEFISDPEVRWRPRWR